MDEIIKEETESVIGNIFRIKRLEQGLVLDEISLKLHVKKNYLQMLEDGNLDMIGSKIYIAGLIKSYGEYLKLDSAEIRKELEKLPSNVSNKKHQLLNLDRRERVIPRPQILFGAVLVFLFLQMIIIACHYFGSDDIITNNLIINQLVK